MTHILFLLGNLVPPSGVEPELREEPHFECGASANSAKEAQVGGMSENFRPVKPRFELHKIPAGYLFDAKYGRGLGAPVEPFGIGAFHRSKELKAIQGSINTGSSMTVHIYYNQPRDYWWLQVEDHTAKCNVTGKPFPWSGRKWILSDKMTDGEVVQSAFMALQAAEEHELRERFKYKGQAIFDPHYDVEKLVALRGQKDALKERAYG